jgi:hypothetical protein
MAAKHLLVLGCSQTKRSDNSLLPAVDRYDGPAYRVLRSFLRNNHWPDTLSVAVLSAKYGLIGGCAQIADYNVRISETRVRRLTEPSSKTLANWAESHSSISISLGKDYLPVLGPAMAQLRGRTEVFDGPIGMKLNQIKEMLHDTPAKSRRTKLPEKPSSSINYYLPDWDDLLDPRFDFERDRFSGDSPKSRSDKHCALLMKPHKLCDGILVSLAQHISSKGALRRFSNNDLASLAPTNLRTTFGLDDDQILFGDCGAFSYANEDAPLISVEQAAALYELHGFSVGASVDHIPVRYVTQNGKAKRLSKRARLERVELTKRNARRFLRVVSDRQYTFTPVGTIQGLDPESYAKNAIYYHSLGYEYIALGGLVPLQDDQILRIVRSVMEALQRVKGRPKVHLFGVFRPKLQSIFKSLGVDSFDSATYFRKAWLRSDQNYLSTSGKWYSAIRIPMTKDPRTRLRLEASGEDIPKLEIMESEVLALLRSYDLGYTSLNHLLDSILEYDQHLSRSADTRSLRAKYAATLADKPWKTCSCNFCQEAGIHMLVFRGANRNKRRGAHNTLMLYNSLH